MEAYISLITWLNHKNIKQVANNDQQKHLSHKAQSVRFARVFAWVSVCTQAGGSLSAKVHSVQTHSAFSCSHVEPNCEAVRNVMVHPLLHTSSVL